MEGTERTSLKRRRMRKERSTESGNGKGILEPVARPMISMLISRIEIRTTGRRTTINIAFRRSSEAKAGETKLRDQ